MLKIWLSFIVAWFAPQIRVERKWVMTSLLLGPPNEECFIIHVAWFPSKEGACGLQ